MSASGAIVAAMAAAFTGTNVVGYPAIIPSQPSGRWYVVYPDEGTFETLSLCGPGDFRTVTWQVSYFAPTLEAVAFMRDRVTSYLFSHWIAVDGWGSGPVEHTISVRARPDEAVRAIPLVTGNDEFSLMLTKD